MTSPARLLPVGEAAFSVEMGDGIDPAVSARDIIRPAAVECLHIAPARISLAKFEQKAMGEFDAHFRLKDRMKDVREDYDEASTIIDLSPRGAAALLRLAIQKLCARVGGTEGTSTTTSRSLSPLAWMCASKRPSTSSG